MSSENQEFQEKKQIYREASLLIRRLFHEASFHQGGEIDSTREERIKIEKKLVDNSFLLDQLFWTLLDIFDIKKIKNVNMNCFTSEDIFNNNANSIVNGLCQNEDPMKVDFYKYNIYGFYIVTCDLLRHMYRFRIFRGNSLWFFESIYRDISSLLTAYSKTIAKQKYNGEDISDGVGTYRSGRRQEIDILFGIRHMLYGGTALDAGSTDLPNIAVFALRNYIEFWLRENFNAYSVGNNFIPVSKIFSVLLKNIDKIKDDPLAKILKGIQAHIETLSIINTWTNTYVHSQFRDLFWMPHIIFKYLFLLKEECYKAYAKSTGNRPVFPPLIPKKASIYQTICQEILSTEP